MEETKIHQKKFNWVGLTQQNQEEEEEERDDQFKVDVYSRKTS